MPGEVVWDAKTQRSEDPLAMIVGIADFLWDTVELVGTLLQLHKDLLQWNPALRPPR